MTFKENSVCTACHGNGRTDVPVCPDCGYSAPRPAASLSRDDLGKIVRVAWVRWARSQPEPKPGWLIGWQDLNEADREVDRQIGEAVVAAIEPPQPAAMLWTDGTAWHAYEQYEDADRDRSQAAKEPPLMVVKEWTWHPKSR